MYVCMHVYLPIYKTTSGPAQKHNLIWLKGVVGCEGHSCTCVYECVYVCIYIHKYVCIHVYINICTYIYIYIIYIYIYIYIYTYIFRHGSSNVPLMPTYNTEIPTSIDPVALEYFFNSARVNNCGNLSTST